MKDVLIVGTGIAGMSAALACAASGCHVILASSSRAEHAQSVLAAGGINAVLADHEAGDSIEAHIGDTLRGGAFLAGEHAVRGLCEDAPSVIRYLESIGTVFSVEDNGTLSKRTFGGQSHRRTCFCKTATGKQIVSAMAMELRRYEAMGLVERRTGTWFHSALIEDGSCHGALLYDDGTKQLETVTADATVMATGGQNALFGKTTGSTQCDGYAAGRLFMQGVVLKNLEFVQYHPTTLETAQKRMLISEAARGEGGRLFYLEGGQRVYFMEDKYGKEGNLKTRDIVSREVAKAEREGHEVYLDVSFLGRKVLDSRLSEVASICRKYRGIDISKEAIPVSPSVHFFMGGLAVDLNHETNIRNLFAVGECASMYHGANRLGGNSLLAAFYGGKRAAEEITRRERAASGAVPDFRDALEEERRRIERRASGESPFSVTHIRDLVAECMAGHLGIVRDGETLREGIADIDYYLSIAGKINYDDSVYPPHMNFGLDAMLALAKATLLCAEFRRESRGAHYRSDYPETDESYAHPTLISYDAGRYSVSLDEERAYES